jgi:hypothetical protein
MPDNTEEETTIESDGTMEDLLTSETTVDSALMLMEEETITTTTLSTGNATMVSTKLGTSIKLVEDTTDNHSMMVLDSNSEIDTLETELFSTTRDMIVTDTFSESITTNHGMTGNGSSSIEEPDPSDHGN